MDAKNRVYESIMNRIRMLKNLTVQHYEQHKDAKKLSLRQHYEQNKDAKKLSVRQHYERNKDIRN